MKIFKGLMVGGVAMLLAMSVYAESKALASPEKASGKVGSNIVIRSKYEYIIINSSSVYQDYAGYEELSVDDKKYKNPIKFSLAPGAKKSQKSDYLSFAYMAVRPGSFIIRAVIKISGYKGAANNAHAELKVSR